MKERNTADEPYADQIDLSSILAVLWKRRKMIILGTFGATMFSIGISFLLPRVYRSEGFYQLGNPTEKISENGKPSKNKPATINKKKTSIGVPVPLYKKSSAQFFNPNRFHLIAGQNKSFKEEDLIIIRTKFITPEDIDKWIKPVYAYAKEDSREFAQLPQDESNSVIGLNLSYEADSAENSYEFVSFFGDYIRDCLLYFTLFNYIMDGYSSTVSQINKIENDIINTQFELLQNSNKMKDIKAIISNYPESAKIENRQLVSIQEGGDRFLSPVTQLVGIESNLADLRRDLAELEREKEKIAIRAEYFSHCHKEMLKIAESGESLFLMLKSSQDKVFKDKDLSRDSLREVFNSLSIDLQTFEFIFYTNSRFISGPTIPDMHIKPKKSLIVMLSCLSSFFIFFFLAFFLDWWQSNKKSIILNRKLPISHHNSNGKV
jgi:hypothetical protein